MPDQSSHITELTSAEYDLIREMRKLKEEYKRLMVHTASRRNDRDQASWQDRLEDAGMNYVRAEEPKLCKKVVGIKPYWMGWGQWDSTKCECLLDTGHEGECKCKHILEGEGE